MQYLCLSDLYLGSSKSLLSKASSELAEGLRKTVLAMNLEDRPILIFMGNTFELSVLNKEKGLRAFVDFLRYLYPQGAPEAFAREIYLLPGNHDRKMLDILEWESLLTEEGDHDDSPGKDFRSLMRFVQDNTHLDNFKVKLVSPGLILTDEKSEKSIFVDHGYLMDSMYRFASTATSWYADEQHVFHKYKLEELNGPWIDFLSSMMKKEFTGEAHSFHKLFSSPWKLRQTTKRLQKKTSELLLGLVPMSALSEVKNISIQLSSAFLEATVARFFQERENDSRSVLSSREQKHLKWYLKNVVGPWVSKDPTFIFGYTQKPFEEYLFTESESGQKNCWQVYNAGGWLLNKGHDQPHFGASAVFIDAELNVSALRLSKESVSVETCSGDKNILSKKLESAVNHERPAWDYFTKRLYQ